MVRTEPPLVAYRTLENGSAVLNKQGDYWYAPPLVPSSAPPPRRKRRRALLLAALAAFAFLSWGYSRYVFARQTSVVLIGASYPDNRDYPPNSYMCNGQQNLAELARGDSGARTYNLRLVQDPAPATTLANWDKELDAVRAGTMLLFLGFHGCADRQGAYFLGPQARSPRADQAGADCLRFETVLKRLRQVPRSRNIVLMLDATQIHRSLVHHDFVWALDKLNDAITDMPNLIVINASDVGQRSWLAQEYRRSIFAHYVNEALKGSADVEPHDGQVTALELVDYVTREVRHWAKTHRDAEQTPAMWPRGHIGRERAGSMVLARLAG